MQHPELTRLSGRLQLVVPRLCTAAFKPEACSEVWRQSSSVVVVVVVVVVIVIVIVIVIVRCPCRGADADADADVLAVVPCGQSIHIRHVGACMHSNADEVRAQPLAGKLQRAPQHLNSRRNWSRDSAFHLNNYILTCLNLPYILPPSALATRTCTYLSSTVTSLSC